MNSIKLAGRVMNLEMVYCCRMIFLKFYGEGGGGGGGLYQIVDLVAFRK